MNQRDLKDYIVKLNDRNIQRQRESGFTLYAILGAMVYCVFYLLDYIDIASSIYNQIKYLNLAVFVSNAIFILSLYYFSYGTATRRYTLTKIFPYKRPLNIEISDFPFFISYLTICFFNFSLLRYSENFSHKLFLIIFGALTLLNIISPFVINLYSLYKRIQKKKKGQTIEEFDFTFFNKRVIRLFSIFFLIYATILSIYLLTVLYKIHFEFESKLFASITKYLLIYFALIYLLKKAIDIKSKEHDNNQLEDFEKEIFFENISNEDIVKRFEKNFYGIPFSKWISDKQIEIINFFDHKRKAFFAQDLLLSEVDEIDKNTAPYEFSGRLENIINTQLDILNVTRDFVERISTAFNNLKKFSSLNEDEVDKLNYVQSYLNHLITSFNNQYINLSSQIEIRQYKR